MTGCCGHAKKTEVKLQEQSRSITKTRTRSHNITRLSRSIKKNSYENLYKSCITRIKP